jgi:hypothetical protein
VKNPSILPRAWRLPSCGDGWQVGQAGGPLAHRAHSSRPPGHDAMRVYRQIDDNGRTPLPHQCPWAACCQPRPSHPLGLRVTRPGPRHLTAPELSLSTHQDYAPLKGGMSSARGPGRECWFKPLLCVALWKSARALDEAGRLNWRLETSATLCARAERRVDTPVGKPASVPPSPAPVDPVASVLHLKCLLQALAGSKEEHAWF